MEKIKLEFTHNQTVANITLDDGKGNVLDHIMIRDIQELLNEFKSNHAIKLIVFEGAGKHFSFGASVEEHKKDHAAAMLRDFHRLFYTLAELGIPTLAKVSGQCLGGGLELAAMCHFIFADKTARFGQPEIVLGVFPPAASVILPEKIGNARADILLITGKSIQADEALSIGLVQKVFENREEMSLAVSAWIETDIVPKSASSLRFAARAARFRFDENLRHFLPQLERIYISHLMETHDANEGIAAFLEKREPQWETYKAGNFELKVVTNHN